jgi:hypothetical protein
VKNNCLHPIADFHNNHSKPVCPHLFLSCLLRTRTNFITRRDSVRARSLISCLRLPRQEERHTTVCGNWGIHLSLTRDDLGPNPDEGARSTGGRVLRPCRRRIDTLTGSTRLLHTVSGLPLLVHLRFSKSVQFLGEQGS